MPGLAQRGVGVPAGVDSLVGMAIQLICAMESPWLFDCGGCLSRTQQNHQHWLVAGVGDGRGQLFAPLIHWAVKL